MKWAAMTWPDMSACLLTLWRPELWEVLLIYNYLGRSTSLKVVEVPLMSVSVIRSRHWTRLYETRKICSQSMPKNLTLISKVGYIWSWTDTRMAICFSSKTPLSRKRRPLRMILTWVPMSITTWTMASGSTFKRFSLRSWRPWSIWSMATTHACRDWSWPRTWARHFCRHLVEPTWKINKNEIS